MNQRTRLGCGLNLSLSLSLVFTCIRLLWNSLALSALSRIPSPTRLLELVQVSLRDFYLVAFLSHTYYPEMWIGQL